jgi:hypothetical protein
MKRAFGLLMGLLVLHAVPVAGQDAGGIEVELWTDRGNESVYKPGEAMELHVRSAEEGYLLVYEIDAEGAVRVLWPERGSPGFIEANRTLSLPSDRSDIELVVEGPVGQGYVVALLSRDPFLEMPWYLKAYDLQEEEIEYAEGPEEEEGVTAEGRIVGDPFVAMERIRRRVLDYPDDSNNFGSAYTSYYVHEKVRYPRYLCSDCHRPNQWAWWDGFDPYYTSCSVFSFRVNSGWYWGPRYWFGYVPYYYFTYRDDCPPSYRVFSTRYTYHSSWDGWRQWTSLWGRSLKRYKSPPPADYVPPAQYKERWPKGRPPGLLADRALRRGRNDGRLTRPLPGDPEAKRDRGGERERMWRSPRPRTQERGGLIPRTRSGERSLRDPVRGRLGEHDRGRLREQDDRRLRDSYRGPFRDLLNHERRLRRDVRGRGGEERGRLRRPSEPERPLRGTADRGRARPPRMDWRRSSGLPEPMRRAEPRIFERPRSEAPRPEGRQEASRPREHRSPEPKARETPSDRGDGRRAKDWRPGL